VGDFATPLGAVSSFQAEFLVSLFSIEQAQQNGLHKLWLESDSLLVIQVFTSIYLGSLPQVRTQNIQLLCSVYEFCR
jgi:hypothetical protein